MPPRVTAILVVHQGGDRLRSALDALRAQRRAPDHLVIVLTQASAEASRLAADAAPGGLVQLEEQLSFGEAVRRAEQTLPPPASDAEALWLLSEDTAPEPGALEALLSTFETAKSVAIAGPKLLDANTPDRIVGLGRSMTRFGAAVPLVTNELDQGQHDGLSDVLGIDPAGALVRRHVWRALDGFDPALHTVDDGLDLAVRARLAGHRVSVVPTAHVRFAAGGLIGPAAGHRATAVRRRAAATRRALLHRRLVYAPAATVPLHWLTLLPLALLRSIVALVTKAPGLIIGEFGSALRAMFGFGGVAHARRTLKRARTTGWSAIAPLRIPPDEMRRRRHLEAEERRARARGRVEGVEFLATGGGWVLLVSVVASVAMLSWVLGAGGLSGGGLLPLSNGVGELWRNAGYGWRDLGAGFVGAADPFAAVLAVLGSIAFWSPSFGIVLLWLLALPLAALGAWFAAARLTDRGALRAAAAIAWMAAPPLITALADGRPGPVLAHVLLGWLVYATLGAGTSWATAATASLLFAAVVASVPSLTPALLVAWVVAMVFSGRGAARLVLLPIPALVLAAPLVITQLTAGNPIALLADPGVPIPAGIPGVWDLALGFDDAALGGWPALIDSLGVALNPAWLVAGLVAPLGVAAVASLAAGRMRAAILALGAALLGFATAVAAGQISVAIVGSTVVPVSPIGGQSLMWLGLVLAAIIAFDALRRTGAVFAALVTVAALVAVAPLAVSIALRDAAIAPAGPRSLPAFVTAEAETDPRVTTLRLAAETDGSLRATIEHGRGATLDDQSTVAQTRPELSADEAALAELAGNLASRSEFDAATAIDEFGIAYVLLAATADDAERSEQRTAERTRVALEANPALKAVAQTDFGALWGFVDAEPDAPAAQIPATAGAPWTGIVATVQLIVFGAVLLLSIPAGVGREEAERTPRRPRRDRRPKNSPPPAAVDDDAVDASGATDEPVADRGTAEEASTAPATDAPDLDAPAVDAPVADAPVADAPAADAPAADAPVADASAADAPAADAPEGDADVR